MDVDGTTTERVTRAKVKVPMQRVPRREKAKENQNPEMESQDKKEKSKSDSKGKGSGKPDGSGKGRTGKPDVTCHKCGKYGHFARDCWSGARQVQNDGQQNAQASPPTTVAGSPSSSSTQLPVASQSNRVARIQFSDAHGSDVQKHDELVLDTHQ